MKKEFIAGIFVALILMSFFSSLYFVHADVEEIQQGIVNTSKGLPSELKNKTKELFQQEIVIPPVVNKFVMGFFKVEREISFSELVIFIALFFFFFILLAYIFEFMPILNKGISRWAGAFIASCLISVSGGTYFAAKFFIDLGNVFNVLNKWGPLKMILALVVVGIIFFALKYVLGILKESYTIGKAKTEGMKAAAGAAMLKSTAETMKSVDEELMGGFKN